MCPVNDPENFRIVNYAMSQIHTGIHVEEQQRRVEDRPRPCWKGDMDPASLPEKPSYNGHSSIHKDTADRKIDIVRREGLRCGKDRPLAETIAKQPAARDTCNGNPKVAQNTEQ